MSVAPGGVAVRVWSSSVSVRVAAPRLAGRRHRVEQRLDHAPTLRVVAALLGQEGRTFGRGPPRRLLGDRGRPSPLLRRHGVDVSGEREGHSCQVPRMLIDHAVFAPTFYAGAPPDPVAARAAPSRGGARSSARIDSSLVSWVFLAAYTCSGLAGLVYEVAWTRLLTLHLGHTTAAASTVVGTFLLGLALGAAVIGRSATRLTRARALHRLCGAGDCGRRRRVHRALATGSAHAAPAMGVCGRRVRTAVPAHPRAVVRADGAGAIAGPGRDLPAGHPRVCRRRVGAVPIDAARCCMRPTRPAPPQAHCWRASC